MALFFKYQHLLRHFLASLSYAVVLTFMVASVAHAHDASAALLPSSTSVSHGVTIYALNPSRVYRVEAISITGNQHFSTSELASAMTTKTRPFYEFWKKRPQFDPDTFT